MEYMELEQLLETGFKRRGGEMSPRSYFHDIGNVIDPELTEVDLHFFTRQAVMPDVALEYTTYHDAPELAHDPNKIVSQGRVTRECIYITAPNGFNGAIYSDVIKGTDASDNQTNVFEHLMDGRPWNPKFVYAVIAVFLGLE